MIKKLIFLLIPIIGYSQISYKDVMSIDSQKMFKKVMIENQYEFDSKDDDGLLYGYNIKRDSIEGNRSTKWGFYGDNDEFIFSFSKNTLLESFFGVDDEDGKKVNEYDLIVKEIKKNCVYYDILTDDEGDDYVCYSCNQSKYKGKIGFMVKEGNGIIRHFIID